MDIKFTEMQSPRATIIIDSRRFLKSFPTLPTRRHCERGTPLVFETSRLLNVKGPKFQHSREQRAGRRGCCPKNDKWRQIASARPSAALPTSEHPRDKGSRSRDPPTPENTHACAPLPTKGPAQGLSKKNRGPCSLEGRKGSKPRPLSPEDRGEAKSQPRSLQGGSGHRGASGGGRAWPGRAGTEARSAPGCGAAGSLGREGQRGLSSCPSSPHLPRRPTPAASLAVTHLPWFPPRPSLSLVPPAERPRAASTRLRQGYEVH